MRFEELNLYDYGLSPELIRKKGVEPRDSARLFVYDTKTDTVTHDFFYNLAKYLPERSLLVLNETRVVPARLWLRKETGGKIEVFVLANEMSFRHSDSALAGETSSPVCHSECNEESRKKKKVPGSFASAQDDNLEIPVLVDRKVSIGQKLFFPNGEYFEVVRQEENKFYVILRTGRDLEAKPLSEYLFALLDRYGETPVPHYLEEPDSHLPARIATRIVAGGRGNGKDKEKENELRRRYQTVFAKTGASVAAPTASLHFTDRVFESLDAKGIDIAKVTLDVGQGTFAPLREENFVTKRLHRERIDVCPDAAAQLSEAKRSGKSIIAVGTTALRTLESVVIASDRMERGNPGLEGVDCFACARNDKRECNRIFCTYSGSTDIFIYPPHEFRSADILVTNFHLPKTSLMLLVDAFLGHKGAKRRIMPLYEEAIMEKYAFYSFGDSMLIR
ncbi:MAG: S-adenosylmethionine:tRNA ribosyltransferase-isomerase [Candidatus Moranbacteria bacterium]|nr:S-adenosylmethionine:tRNA ribosyltransferase-isomerase [Candidatus Moranbacteria bacterium]